MMKKVPVLCLATALIASSSLWANETNTTANANTATTGKTMPYGDNPSLGRVLLYKTGQGLQNLGNAIQGASEHSAQKMSQSWQEAKSYSAEQSQVIQAKAEQSKAAATKKLQQTQDAIFGTTDGNVPIERQDLSPSSAE